jgi:hypothetical protein
MHGNNTGKLPMSYLYLKLAKRSCFSFYFLSSTKSENRRAEQVVGLGEKGW